MPFNNGVGTNISWSEIQAAYGGMHPISLSEYFKSSNDSTEVPDEVGAFAFDGETYTGNSDADFGQLCVEVKNQNAVPAFNSSGSTDQTVGNIEVTVDTNPGGVVAAVNESGTADDADVGGFAVDVTKNTTLSAGSGSGSSSTTVDNIQVTVSNHDVTNTSTQLITGGFGEAGTNFIVNTGGPATTTVTVFQSTSDGSFVYTINGVQVAQTNQAGLKVTFSAANGAQVFVTKAFGNPSNGAWEYNRTTTVTTQRRQVTFTNQTGHTINLTATGGGVSANNSSLANGSTASTGIYNGTNTSWSFSYPEIADYDVDFTNNSGHTITLNSSSTGGAQQYTNGQTRKVKDDDATPNWTLAHDGITGYDINFTNNTGGAFEITAGSTGGARTLSTGTTEVSANQVSPSWVFESPAYNSSGNGNTSFGGFSVDVSDGDGDDFDSGNQSGSGSSNGIGVAVTADGTYQVLGSLSVASGTHVPSSIGPPAIITVTSNTAWVYINYSSIGPTINWFRSDGSGGVGNSVAARGPAWQSGDVITTGFGSGFVANPESLPQLPAGGHVGLSWSGGGVSFQRARRATRSITNATRQNITFTNNNSYPVTLTSASPGGSGQTLAAGQTIDVQDGDTTNQAWSFSGTFDTYDVSFTNNTSKTVTTSSDSTGGATTFTAGQTIQVGNELTSPDWTLNYAGVDVYDIVFDNGTSVDVAIDTESTGGARTLSPGTTEVATDADSPNWTVVSNAFNGTGTGDTCLGGLNVDVTNTANIAAATQSGTADANVGGFSVDVTSTTVNTNAAVAGGTANPGTGNGGTQKNSNWNTNATRLTFAANTAVDHTISWSWNYSGITWRWFGPQNEWRLNGTGQATLTIGGQAYSNTTGHWQPSSGQSFYNNSTGVAGVYGHGFPKLFWSETAGSGLSVQLNGSNVPEYNGPGAPSLPTSNSQALLNNQNNYPDIGDSQLGVANDFNFPANPVDGQIYAVPAQNFSGSIRIHGTTGSSGSTIRMFFGTVISNSERVGFAPSNVGTVSGSQTLYDVDFTNNNTQPITLNSSSTGGAQTYTVGQTRKVKDNQSTPNWTLSHNGLVLNDVVLTNNYDLPVILNAATTGISTETSLADGDSLTLIDDQASTNYTIVVDGVTTARAANLNVPFEFTDGEMNSLNANVFNDVGDFGDE